jgi:hypothetical protein
MGDSLDRFGLMGQEDIPRRDPFVFKETIGGFGCRPIFACLIDGRFRFGVQGFGHLPEPLV